MMKVIAWGLALVVAIVIGLGTLCIGECADQPLEPWHTVRLSEEFDARMLGDEVQDFDDYLALEDRLFSELRDKVYSKVETGPAYVLARYSNGSAADPATREPDYNRSFEFESVNPKGGVLLLHGMSDSPYSLHALGEKLHDEGYWVIGLRLPGHGTSPGELKHATWRDMAAATRLAMTHLAAQVGDKPVHIAGYSTGAPLALDLTLNSFDEGELRTPDSLILISPAIGISAVAMLARPAAAIGRIPGLSQLGWSEITPEFDPYKYNSFTTNAGSQVRQLTESVASRIAKNSATQNRMPPILVFKSAVDATVSTTAVVDRLMARLPENGNEIVLFDINRSAITSALLVSDPGPLTSQLMERGDLPFSIRLITNENPESIAVVSRLKPPFSADVTEVTALGTEWPRGIISLSHVALPFAPDDSLYGRYRPASRDKLFLGQAEIRGERGLLKISSDWLLRLRYNPFYPVLEDRVIEWLSDLQGSVP